MTSIFFVGLPFFVIPVPYVSLASILGCLAFLMKRELRRIVICRQVFLVVLMVSLNILVVNLYLSIQLSYEEFKRFLVPWAVFGNLVFSIYIFKNQVKCKINYFLVTTLCAYTLATQVWWKLPPGFENYTWFKYVGGLPLYALIFQVVRNSGLYESQILYLGFVILIVTFAIVENSKSLAFIALVTCLRIYFTSKTRTSLGMYKTFLFMISAFIVLLITYSLGALGFLGKAAEAALSQYGANLFSALILARPEFPLSLHLLSNVNAIGYGTPSTPQFDLASDYSITGMNLGLAHAFLDRVLGSGFNMHSWAFDYIFRIGFVGFFLSLLIFFICFKVLQSDYLARNAPSLVFLAFASIFNLFFSPLTWFSAIDISLVIFGFWLATDERSGGKS